MMNIYLKNILRDKHKKETRMRTLKNTIRVFTKDLIELDKCHNSRARELIKKKQATIFIYNNEKCLKINKCNHDILNEKDQL